MSEKVNNMQAEPTLDELRAQVAAAKQNVQTFSSVQTKPGSTRTPYYGWTEELATSFGYSVLGFGIIVLLLVSLLIMKSKADVNTITRAFGLVLIIVAAVFLVVAGYTQEQIAPVIGLLGAIAGYLLGTDSKRQNSDKDQAVKKE